MSVVFGLGLMAGGSALLVLSLEQHERFLGASSMSNPAVSVTHTATPTATAPPTPTPTTPAVSTSARPVVSVPSASVSAPASAGAAASDSPLAVSFGFAPNDVVLVKEDLDRLKAFGLKLRAAPKIKMSIEAYQDDGSPDTPSKNLAKRRVAIIREVLTAIGIPPERITPAPADSPVSPGKAVVRLSAPLEGAP